MACDPSSSPNGGTPSQLAETPSTARGFPAEETTRNPDTAISFTFTPPGDKAVPRAWERRPATPYLPRNDGQKIWKRVPLGPIASNGSDGWWKGNRLPHPRPLKRLRVDSSDSEDDKENTRYVGSKWELVAHPTPSPKRKPLGAARRVNKGVESGAALGAAALLKEEDESEHDRQQEDDSERDREEEGKWSEAPDGPHGLHSLHSQTEHESVDTLSFSEQRESSERDATPVPFVTTIKGCFSPTAMVRTNKDKMPTPANTADQAASMHPCPTQSYPAIIGPQSESPNDFDDAEASSLQAEPTSGVESLLLLSDHDDTAFLHDFLSRARAQRAAKRQSTPELSTTDTTIAEMNEEPRQQPVASMDEVVAERGAPGAQGQAVANLDEDPITEVSVTSPCRRSSRLMTRVPRPAVAAPKVPSTIALKRLNGTEFIATQREAHSLAIATRTNTRRNKADSVSVHIRLMQLKAEEKARQLDTGGSPDETETERANSRGVKWDAVEARYEDGRGSREALGEDTSHEDREPSKLDVEAAPESDVHATDPSIGQEDSKPAKRVRRLRKLNIGTVNGTPARKRVQSRPGHVALAALNLGSLGDESDTVDGAVWDEAPVEVEMVGQKRRRARRNL